jgi:hypothetical protein
MHVIENNFLALCAQHLAFLHQLSTSKRNENIERIRGKDIKAKSSAAHLSDAIL